MTTLYTICVTPRHPAPSAQALRTARQLGIASLQACYPSRLYFLQGDLTRDEAERLARALLADPVTEVFTLERPPAPAGAHLVEATYHAGVTDPAAESLLRSAHLLGYHRLTACATGSRYELHGALMPDELGRLAREVFSNPVIQHVAIDALIDPPFVAVAGADDTVERVPVRDLDDAGLLALSAERRLSLDLNEMQAIRAYFRAIGREPSDAELEMLAQTWSEHCVHKTFKARITYTGPAHGAPPDAAPVTQDIDGLLRTYLRAATERLNKPWVVSAFVDNAGIIRFDDEWDIAFKMETHNRPSAIEPFGGANTGVGGVIRDVLGVSARPIANTDVLFFGLPDAAPDSLPQGVLHPRRIAEGVVAGIEDYGNKMGIPTVNGAIVYHPGYTANPLVFCGCVGVLPHGSHRNTAQPGDYIVVIGGRTGRDGLRGATFSSMEMDTTTAQVSGGAVQIGHAINEKQVQEVVLRARDAGLYTAITDCGAGGLSSAVGEMGAEIGARVQLADVPLKYPGLRPWEIWLSEAQERMVLAIPPQNWARFKAICDGQDVTAVVIGTFEPTGHLRLYYGEQVVGDLAMAFLHDGIPTRHMQAEWSPVPPVPAPDYTDKYLSVRLANVLRHPTIRTKEDVIRRYDHEVQGGTAIRPLVGAQADAPADAAVLVLPFTARPRHRAEGREDTPPATRAIALANGHAPTYGEIDPYAMAWASVDEALRNLVAVGADPDQVAILDNFSWGNTQLPDRLGALVRCAQGCYDAAIAYGTPFISGKDSLNNEYLGADGQRHAIPGTLVISAVGIVPDVAQTVTADAKAAGDLLYLIGETRAELGGSYYHLAHGLSGGTVPQPVPGALATLRALHQAIRAGLVRACHDVSEGGLAVALAEMALGGRLGMDIDLTAVNPALSATVALFSESAGRFVVEVRQGDAARFEAILRGHTVRRIGTLTPEPFLSARRGTAGEVLRMSLAEIERAWRGNELTEQATPFVPPVPRTEAPTRPVVLPAEPPKPSRPPRVLILHANGTNRDHDAALACTLAGGEPEIVHVNQLFNGERRLLDYHMLVVPGGFSYGDDLGAGVLWALDLRERLRDIDRFVADGRPVLGICNGFQTLVKAGLIDGATDPQARRVTLTYNESGRFECRWVYLQPDPSSPCLFTEGLTDLIHCPVAHGEGRVALSDPAALDDIVARRLNALTYVSADGQTGGYPVNPNGSAAGIAGLCNAQGNVFGLMPHPENHVYPWQNPRYHRGVRGMDGLALFVNGIKRS